jgi:hypothetical protein
MTQAGEDWEILFEAGLEGGCIYVYHDASQPQPYRAANSEYYELPDEDLDASWYRDAATFDEAFAHFDKYAWHTFVPVFVHPSVRVSVGRAWRARMSGMPPAEHDRSKNRVERWQMVLAGPTREPPRDHMHG